MTRHARANNIIPANGLLVVGAGLAGLFAALKASCPVTILSATALGSGASSSWAQGGIAAALGQGDSPEQHAQDTIAAGAGIVDPRIAHLIAREAAARIEDLSRLGVPFDRDAQGKLVLGREAAHSRNRIARVTGDRAGAAIMTALVAAARATPRIRILEGFVAFELAIENGRVVGVYAHPLNDKATPILLTSQATVFALGGIGGLYQVSTNPPQACGQGVGMAARAGATIADPEFVQFHPTAIDIGRDPAPLATEALRGEGAELINDRGERFMPSLHKDAELAPRDVVARGIFRQIRAGRRVFLDATRSIGTNFPGLFPTVFSYCSQAGIDPRVMPIPVAPAAHYHMGGIAVDDDGRTSLPGLWAIGECASTGAHGANRLASNSLLEAIVFGARAAMDAGQSFDQSQAHETNPLPAAEPAPLHAFTPAFTQLRKIMTAWVGLERTGSELIQAMAALQQIERTTAADPDFRNMSATALLVASAAFNRTESRGGHFRSDYPGADLNQTHRTFLTLADARATIDLAIRETKLEASLKAVR